MKVRIKRIDKSLPLPLYHTKGAAGFDIYSRVDAVIKPKELILLPTNLAVETPAGYMLMMMARSSTFRKKGLVMANALAIFDEDFRGDEDEMIIQAYNLTDDLVEVKKGERLTQGIFVKYNKAEWEETDKMGSPSRGGIGSTG